MATQNTDLKEAKKDAIMTPDMYRSMFLRQFTSQCSQSYDKMMAMGFMYTIQKPLRKIYPNDDDYYAALDRHTEFFNITPHVLPFVAGLTVSMEEQAAADKNFDTSSINAMKVGLMGPLSGIGDSFYWGTFRVVAAGIGIGIASTGNPLGPIVYALIYSVINFATRIVAAHLGYDLGRFGNQVPAAVRREQPYVSHDACCRRSRNDRHWRDDCGTGLAVHCFDL